MTSYFDNLKLAREDDLDEEVNDDLNNITDNDVKDDIDVLSGDGEELVALVNEASLGHEAYDILSQARGSHVDKNYFRDSVMYTCGMLGMDYHSVMSDVKTENLFLHTEKNEEDGFLTKFIKKLVYSIKLLWEKIKEFFKNTWIKIQAKYYGLTKNIFNLRKKVYGLRNKSNIIVSKNEMISFIESLGAYWPFTNLNTNEHPGKIMYSLSKLNSDFCNSQTSGAYLNFMAHADKFINASLGKTIDNDKEVEEFSKVLRVLTDHLSSSFGIKKDHPTIADHLTQTIPDDRRSYIDFITGCGLNFSVGDDNYYVLGICKSRNGNPPNFKDLFLYKRAISWSDSSLIKDVSDSITKNTNGYGDFTEIDYTALMELAESVDAMKRFIQSISKGVFKLNQTINKAISSDALEKFNSDSDNKSDRAFYFHAALLVSRITMDYIQSMLKSIRTSSKVIGKLYKIAIKTSTLGIKKFYDDIVSGKITEIPFDAEHPPVKITDASEWKLEEPKKDICFIKPGRRFLKDIEVLGAAGGFVPLLMVIKGQNAKADKLYPNKDKLRQAMVDGRYGGSAEDHALDHVFTGGVVFIDVDAVTDPKHYVYPLFGSVGIEFVYYHELGHVLTGQQESLLKTDGDLTDLEVNGFTMYATLESENKADAYACLRCGISPEKVVEARYKSLDIWLRSVTNSEAAIKAHLDSANKVKDIMLNNIKKEMNGMRSIAKLTPYQYLRSKFTKYDKGVSNYNRQMDILRKEGHESRIERAIAEKNLSYLKEALNTRISDFPDLIEKIKKGIKDIEGEN